MKSVIHTSAAPKAIGPYSQAIRVGNVVYCSGQIALDPVSGEMRQGSVEAQIQQVLANLKAVCVEAGGGLNHIVKLTVYLRDLNDFAAVNALMAEYFQPPYPARAAVEVSRLPKDALVEMDAILAFPE